MKLFQIWNRETERTDNLCVKAISVACRRDSDLGGVDFDYGVTLADGLLLPQQDGGTSQNLVSQTRVQERNRLTVDAGFTKNLIRSKSSIQ